MSVSYPFWVAKVRETRLRQFTISCLRALRLAGALDGAVVARLMWPGVKTLGFAPVVAPFVLLAKTSGDAAMLASTVETASKQTRTDLLYKVELLPKAP